MKVGRNDLCPCGSGKKFKKCHLNMPSLSGRPVQSRPTLPPDVWRDIEKHRLEQEARVQAFGHIREPVQIPDYNGYRMVAVRGRMYFSKKWRFFSDFLFEYGKMRFGKEWLDAQNLALASDQHPLYVWRMQAHEFMLRQKPQPDGTFVTRPSGPMAACNNFYYDLYTVDDNSILDETLLTRLKHRDQFQGALHELAVEATCLRAGFTVTRENERDPTRKHVEFVAVHRPTGQHVLVEAKSRHRTGVMGRPGAKKTSPDIRFRGLINEAVAKDPNNPLALFVDTNLPADRAERFYAPQSTQPLLPSKAMVTLMEKVRNDYGKVDPYNLLVFSNNPQRDSPEDQIAPGSRWAAFLSERPRVPVFHREALHDLIKAANLYGNVPTHFPPDRNSR